MSTIDTSSIKILGQTQNTRHQKERKLDEASKELEAVFISYVLKAMEQTIPKDKDSSSNNLAKMMFSSVMGKAIAEQGGLGLKEFIFKSLAESGENPIQKFKLNSNLDALYHINSFGGIEDD
jgi:Rod binding domain-containing protein